MTDSTSDSNSSLLIGAIEVWTAQIQAVQAASSGPEFDRRMSHADAVARYRQIDEAILTTLAQEWAESTSEEAERRLEWLHIDLDRARRHALACVNLTA